MGVMWGPCKHQGHYSRTYISDFLKEDRSMSPLVAISPRRQSGLDWTRTSGEITTSASRFTRLLQWRSIFGDHRACLVQHA